MNENGEYPSPSLSPKGFCIKSASFVSFFVTPFLRMTFDTSPPQGERKNGVKAFGN
jgi:hypothetical protein